MVQMCKMCNNSESPISNKSTHRRGRSKKIIEVIINYTGEAPCRTMINRILVRSSGIDLDHYIIDNLLKRHSNTRNRKLAMQLIRRITEGRECSLTATSKYNKKNVSFRKVDYMIFKRVNIATSNESFYVKYQKNKKLVSIVFKTLEEAIIHRNKIMENKC